MEKSMQSKLKYGFTIARWGVDMCFGALLLTAALVVRAAAKEEANPVKTLMIPFSVCIVGLLMFAVGRVLVGLCSRQLNLNTERPLTGEEKWFVGCMLEMEEKGAGAAFLNSAARMTGSVGDDIAAGTASMAVAGTFFKIGKRYMGHGFLVNRLPAIVSLVIAVVITVIAII